VSGSLNLAQQWLGNAGYLLRLISNAVGIEANRISTARATKVLVEAAGNKTTSTVNQDASQALCTSSKAVTACNHMNTRIQGGAVKVRFLAAQTGGVAYILALTANFMNLGVDANQILNVVLADPAPPAHPLNGVPLGSAVQAAEAVAGLIGPIQANLAGAMNETQVIALPRAFLSADTPNGLPFEDYGVPVVIEWVKRYVRERNLTDNWLPCCDTANSEAILEADLATLLSSQCLLAGYVLSDVAAGIRIGLQGLADLSLLTAMAKNPARPGPPR